MDIKQAVTRLEALRTETDHLIQGVRLEFEPGDGGHDIERVNTAILYCFLAALLIDNPARDEGAVWPLLAKRVSPELLEHPEVAKQKEYLSVPLNGTSTQVLSRMRILPISGPWRDVEQAVQNSLNAEQILVMRLLDETQLRGRPQSDEVEPP